MNGVSHVGITVNDLAESIRFYTSVLEFELLRSIAPSEAPALQRLVGVAGSRIEGAMLKSPAGEELELVHFLHPKKKRTLSSAAEPGTVHVALSVRSMTEVCARLRDYGAELVSDPVELGVNRLVYSRDPNGIILELIEFGGSTTSRKEA